MTQGMDTCEMQFPDAVVVNLQGISRCIFEAYLAEIDPAFSYKYIPFPHQCRNLQHIRCQYAAGLVPAGERNGDYIFRRQTWG